MPSALRKSRADDTFRVAPAVEGANSQGSFMSAIGPYVPETSELGQAAQQCIEIQIRREVGDLAVGDQVLLTVLGARQEGQVRAFTCADGAPAALVLLTGPRQWVYIRKLGDLQRVRRGA
jgi:hypothetical protein